MTRSEVDHYVFYCHSTIGVICLVVYVNDSVIICNDKVGVG